jgi:hypothetical protein
MYGAFETARDFSVPALPRRFTRNFLIYGVSGGRPTLQTPTFADASQVLQTSS